MQRDLWLRSDPQNALMRGKRGVWFMLLQMWEPDDDEDAFAMASCKSPARRVINVLRRFIKRKVICKKICKINRYNKLLLKYIIVSAYCF